MNQKYKNNDNEAFSFGWCLCAGFVLALLFCLPLLLQAGPVRVKFTTTKGDFTIRLFDDTPQHRDNFVRLVREGFYDGLLFHRVIADFMAQTGDSTSRHPAPDALYGDCDLGYTLPAEIRFPQYFHKRGAVAAAREGDDVNPDWRSNASQFYVVWGRPCSANYLKRVAKQIGQNIGQPDFQFPESIAETYMLQGGAPWLDATYTVFGEVEEGIETVGDIQYVETNEDDRPLINVTILKAEVLE